MTRAARLLIPVAIISAFAGCEWLQKLRPNPQEQTKATGPVNSVPATELVSYLNAQAANMNSIHYPDVAIKVFVNKEEYNLTDSTLHCSKPRNFLLVGGKGLVGEVVHLGSNDREFWMYSRFPEKTYVFCSHTDFQQGKAELPFPFDPDWALQALGMATFDPNLPFTVDTVQKDRQHYLTLATITPQGAQVKKVIVFEADQMTGARPQVRRHYVVDASGKTIASADVKEVTTIPIGTDPTSRAPIYAQVPTKVTLDWPVQQFKMEMRLRTPKVNERISDAEAQQLFTRPIKDGVTPVNLADARFVPSARGATPGPDRPRKP